ncbi:hypothetical protein [Dongia rigui]|uniref:Uncharacterized protein n=1 Tax=Dongia rigui TaxID=940149 RepID=A0ABU5E2Q6_9PROT|nr:hypothetical protein [Dongia rigui]MDY0873851.1 hypothetical protein [Dongia rigui]
MPVYSDTNTYASWNSYGSDAQGSDNRANEVTHDDNACVVEDNQPGYDTGSDSCTSDSGSGGDSGGSSN